VALLCLLLPGPVRAQLARNRVLQEVRQREAPGGWEIVVSFDSAMRYVRHTPRSRADFVEIELEPVGIASDEIPTPARESLRPRFAPGGAPLREVLLGVGPRGTRRLELRFSRSVDFDVVQSEDLRHVEISVRGGPSSERDRQARNLLEQGREAMESGDHERAVQLYTKALELAGAADRPRALELLGLARERNGQRAHARAEYERYLEQYPDGEGAGRVRQRLLALTTSGEEPPKTFESATRRRDSELEYRARGSLAAHYSRAQFFVEGFDDRVYDSSQMSDVYLNGRVTSPDWEIEGTLSARQRFDFTDGELGSDSRLDEILLEFSQRGRGVWGNLGRQRGQGGVLGRFDGGRLGYRPLDWLDVSLLGGFPLADYASDDVNTDRYQLGLVTNVLEIADLVDAEFYGNYVSEEGLVYRAAIGSELRHLRPRYSAVASVDYDVYFASLNYAMFLADVQLRPEWSVDTHLEYRSSPFITLGNALIGQPADDLAELRKSFSDKQIESLAKDRTAHSTVLSLGSTYRIDERFELLGRISASDLSGTDSSGGLIGTQGTGFEWGYHAQLSGYGILHPKGISTIALQLFDGDRSMRYGIQLNGRYPLLPDLRLNPILRCQLQDLPGGDLLMVTPRLRLDYTLGPFLLDLDFAWEIRRNLGNSVRPDEHGYLLYTGLRYDF